MMKPGILPIQERGMTLMTIGKPKIQGGNPESLWSYLHFAEVLSVEDCGAFRKLGKSSPQNLGAGHISSRRSSGCIHVKQSFHSCTSFAPCLMRRFGLRSIRMVISRHGRDLAWPAPSPAWPVIANAVIAPSTMRTPTPNTSDD